jgi:hypothetical protein
LVVPAECRSLESERHSAGAKPARTAPWGAGVESRGRSTEHLADLSDAFLRERVVLGDQVHDVSRSRFEESAKAPWRTTIVDRMQLSSSAIACTVSTARQIRLELPEPRG